MVRPLQYSNRVGWWSSLKNVKYIFPFINVKVMWLLCGRLIFLLAERLVAFGLYAELCRATPCHADRVVTVSPSLSNKQQLSTFP